MKKLLCFFIVLQQLSTVAQTTELVLQTGNTYIKDIVFTPDGKQLFVGGQQLKLWDVATGREIMTYHGELAGSNVLAHTTDCKYIASGSQRDTIYIWNSSQPDILSKLTGHTESVYTLAFSPDGKYLATGSWDNTIILWDVHKEKMIRKYTNSDNAKHITSVAFSPDSRFVLASRSYEVIMWEIKTGRQVKLFKGFTTSIPKAVFHPDDRHIISCQYDGQLNTWDLATGKLVTSYRRHTSPIETFDCSTDGKYLISGNNDSTIRYWDFL